MTNHRCPRLVSAFVACAMILSFLMSSCASPVPEATEAPPSPTSAPTAAAEPTDTAEPSVEPTREPGVQVGHLASPQPASNKG
jgi:hypothetical protein